MGSRHDGRRFLNMWFEIAALAVVLLIALSVLWSTLRTGMSPMPSSVHARAAMLTALSETEGPVAELGSGWGHLLVAVARRYPHRQVEGYEVSWLPWLVSLALKHGLRLHNLTIHRQDFLVAIDRGELSAIKVMLCYLHGDAMSAINERLEASLLPPHGQLEWLISNNFALGDHQPQASWQLRDFYRSPVYRYRLSSRAIHQCQ